MEVYNESKTEILETYDISIGKLVADKIVKVHHEATAETKAETVEEVAKRIVDNGGEVITIDGESYEVIGTYKNGKDVKKIEAVTAVPAKEAYDEYEDIEVYIPYTEEELTENKRAEIRARRETECFTVINRGKLWYDKLTEENEIELADWYEAWLDAPETLVVPDRLEWLDKNLNNNVEE